MRVTRWLTQVLCIAALLPLHAVAGGVNDTLESRQLKTGEFDAKAIDAFAGDAKVAFPEEAITQAVSVIDRIDFKGYLVNINRLKAPNGTAIDWGHRYKEPSEESVIIYDPAGRPRMLAATIYTANIIARYGTEPWATTPEQYQRAANFDFGKTMVTVFVRDKRDLEVYLPYLKRWVQASFLGMDVDCTRPGMAEACRFAGQVVIPMRAYLLRDKRAPEALAVPSVNAANIPLEAFR